MKAYNVLKNSGGLLMIIIGAWTVPAISQKMGFNTNLNMFIAACGLGFIILASYLESKGEI